MARWLSCPQDSHSPPGDWEGSLGSSFSWWWWMQKSKSSQVLSTSLLVSRLLTSHWPNQVICPEPRYTEVRPALQSYMVKSTETKGDKERNIMYQRGQRDWKRHTWLMTKKGNENWSPAFKKKLLIEDWQLYLGPRRSYNVQLELH